LPVLVFPHFWDNKDFVTKMVAEYDITAFTYRPLKIEYKQNSIVSYYAVGKNILPVITDVLNFDKCVLDVANKALRPTQIPNFEWDVVITGSKASDVHPLIDKFDFTSLNNIETPLWEWTDEEVYETIAELNIPIDTRGEKYNTGNWNGCIACTTTKEQVWCYKQNKMIAGAR